MNSKECLKLLETRCRFFAQDGKEYTEIAIKRINNEEKEN